jgi:hypothetical protein
MSFHDGAKKAKITPSDLQNGFRMGNKNAEITGIFMALKINNVTFCVLTTCSWVGRYQRLGETCYLLLGIRL